MHKRFKIKIFATNLAISFFFASILVLCIYFICEKQINYYTTLINKTTVNNNLLEEAVYNKETKRLIKFPSYGKKYGIIKIPSIEVNLPLYYGDSLKILRYGIGQYSGSFFPGEGGTIVLAGHNNPGILHELDNISKGDSIIIEANYGTYSYEVTEYKVVKETDLEAFNIQDKEEILIIYTCYPINRSIIGRKTERFVVYAKLVGERYE